MSVDSLFKVIVVGGGPVGLTAAHALSQAGIEFIVLEHRSYIVVDVGASLVLWPQGLRVLAQLGLLEQLRRIGADLQHVMTVTFEAQKYKENWAPQTLKKK
jgi:2-polyprenyl-6-methoxyphenol hydroxylase-like FAD-dependent oxidoreductase